MIGFKDRWILRLLLLTEIAVDACFKSGKQNRKRIKQTTAPSFAIGGNFVYTPWRVEQVKTLRLLKISNRFNVHHLTKV